MPADALNLWVLNSAWLDSDDNLTLMCVLIYGVYMTFNHCKHSHLQFSQHVFDHMIQQCKQGTAGHPRSMRLLDSRGPASITYVLCE